MFAWTRTLIAVCSKSIRSRKLERPKARRFGSPVEGSILVGILITTGLVLLIVMLSNQKQLSLKVASKALDAGDSYEMFISGYTGFLQDTINSRLNGLCSGSGSGLTSLSFHGKGVSFRTHIAAKDVPTASALVKRCQNPVFASNQGRFYFCLQFDPNPAYARESFAGAERNFTEVSVQMVDRWQKPISCADFKDADPETVGLQFRYHLFWITAMQPNRLFQKRGYYYGLKE